MTICEPGDLAEAAYDLGWAAEPGHLDALVAEAEVRHDFDVEAVRWSLWSPCPEWGESSWQCIGELHTPGDVLECQLVVSEDHEMVQTWRWQSNGREPASWRADDLYDAAVAHADTAPTKHHPRRGSKTRQGHETEGSVSCAAPILRMPTAAERRASGGAGVTTNTRASVPGSSRRGR